MACALACFVENLAPATLRTLLLLPGGIPYVNGREFVDKVQGGKHVNLYRSQIPR